MSRRSSVRVATRKFLSITSLIMLLIVLFAIASGCSAATVYEDTPYGRQTAGLYHDHTYIGELSVVVPAGFEVAWCAVVKHKISEFTLGSAKPRYIDKIGCKIFSNSEVRIIEVYADWPEENRT